MPDAVSSRWWLDPRMCPISCARVRFDSITERPTETNAESLKFEARSSIGMAAPAPPPVTKHHNVGVVAFREIVHILEGLNLVDHVHDVLQELVLVIQRPSQRRNLRELVVDLDSALRQNFVGFVDRVTNRVFDIQCSRLCRLRIEERQTDFGHRRGQHVNEVTARDGRGRRQRYVSGTRNARQAHERGNGQAPSHHGRLRRSAASSSSPDNFRRSTSIRR